MQTGVTLANPDSRVNAKDILEVSQGLPSEVSRPGMGGAELSLKAFPRNRRRLLEIAHPVGEPDIEVDGQGRSLQLMDRSEIDGHCGPRDFLEEDLTQCDLRTPRWPSREELARLSQPRNTDRSHNCRA